MTDCNFKCKLSALNFIIERLIVQSLVLSKISISKGRDTLSPGLVGLSISYALSITQALTWFIRQTSDIETNIVAVERLKEFEDNEKEADWYKGLEDDWNRKGSKDDWNRRGSKDDWKKGLKSTSEDLWPKEGKIEFVEYSMRYR
jgi:ABC-type multidrug transport system fused ATPase/permease subunit